MEDARKAYDADLDYRTAVEAMLEPVTSYLEKFAVANGMRLSPYHGGAPVHALIGERVSIYVWATANAKEGLRMTARYGNEEVNMGALSPQTLSESPESVLPFLRLAHECVASYRLG